MKSPEAIDIGALADRCGQLRQFRDARGCIPEPLWHLGLGVLAHVNEGDKAAQLWSAGHETYSEDETRRRLDRLRLLTGPTTCAGFHKVAPTGCETCPFFGKAKTPLDTVQPKAMAQAALTVDAASDTGAAAAGDLESIFRALAALPAIDYDRLRVAKAEELGCRVGTLDEEVARRRSSTEDGTRSGRALALPTPEPWPNPVDGSELLEAMAHAIGSYVRLSEAAAIAVALWCLHAHALDASFISPRLAITSPEKRCGKTTLLRVIQELVPKSLPAANITAAALFRTVEAAQPTLLIDEADAFLKDSEELRGIINSGHARDGQVIRLVGDDHEPRTFSTFCPTAIAAIGTIPGTIEDRSIVIALRRRRKDEPVTQLRTDRTGELQDLN